MLLLKRIMMHLRLSALIFIIIPLLVLICLFFIILNLSSHLTVEVILEEAKYLIYFTGLLYTASIIIFLIIINRVFKKHLKSLKDTLDYAKKLASGDLTGDIKITGKDELGELTRTIKHMRDRLQYSVVKLKNSYEREKAVRKEVESANEQITDFLKKVSTELNTPLAPIISYSNMIVADINNGKYDKELSRKIRSIRSHADDMLNITSNLNELARLEAREIELNITEFESSKFIEELINLHHYSAVDNSLSLKYIYSKDFPEILSTDREILFHILSNILAYSIHFSPKNAEIIVRAECSDDMVVFEICDNIVDAHNETIINIFKNSSNRISNMTLHLSNARLFGLVSAASNAELLEGNLTADSNIDIGCVFKLNLNKGSVTPQEEDRKIPLIHTASNIH